MKIISRTRLINQNLAPFLIQLEPLLSRIYSNRLVVFYAHLYPDRKDEYHPELFLRNLSYLNKKCNVLPLSQALESLKRDRQLPPRAVSVVVDDATRSFWETGKKLLDGIGLPYTLAVIPGLIPSNRRDHLLARLMRIGGHQYWLAHREMLNRITEWFGEDNRDQTLTFEQVFQRASRLNKEELQELLGYVRAVDDQFMSWQEIRELTEAAPVEIASHTMSHPWLSLCSGEWLDWELGRSREIIQEELGRDIETLVVPYGNRSHLHSEVLDVMKENGYRYSFLTRRGTVSPESFNHGLPRMNFEVETWRFKLYTCPALCSYLFPGGKRGIQHQAARDRP